VIFFNEKGHEFFFADSLLIAIYCIFIKVRTFGCRNGLSVLKSGGCDAFVKYTNGLLEKWGISERGKDKWKPFFRAWARYAMPLLTGNPKSYANSQLPPLTGYSYLDHLEHFTLLYESGTFSKESITSNCTFRGLVMVVAVKQDMAELVADFVAEKLGGAKRIFGAESVDSNLMSNACEAGGGVVCSIFVEEGFGKIRKLLNKYADFMSLLLFQCSENEIREMLLPNAEERKILGMIKGWQKTKCLHVIELPFNSLFDPDSMDVDERQREFKPTNLFIGAMAYVQISGQVDERPGALFFFPAIPGSGKSALTKDLEERISHGPNDRKTRHIWVQVGDKTIGKYWSTVKRLRQKDQTSICVADKNAPPPAWSTVGDVCAQTRALAIPILPDATCLSTTRIQGYRKPNGCHVPDVIHIYPFSFQYLAVCMARVLDRAAESHAGKLDSATPRACLIVVNFFCFYRTISSEAFFDVMANQLSSAGALVTPSPVIVPFGKMMQCKESFLEKIEALLNEAVGSQVSCSVRRLRHL
jgi:hypothetical protein